jgi:hypothetical protein
MRIAECGIQNLNPQRKVPNTGSSIVNRKGLGGIQMWNLKRWMGGWSDAEWRRVKGTDRGICIIVSLLS